MEKLELREMESISGGCGGRGWFLAAYTTVVFGGMFGSAQWLVDCAMK